MDADVFISLSHFKGHEQILALVRNRTPKYGNDDDAADSLIMTMFEIIYALTNDRPTMCGGRYRVEMLPTTCHVYFGEVMQATPNGRRAGKPLSEGISPTQGSDSCGPTAVIRSAAKMDHLSAVCLTRVRKEGNHRLCRHLHEKSDAESETEGYDSGIAQGEAGPVLLAGSDVLSAQSGNRGKHGGGHQKQKAD